MELDSEGQAGGPLPGHLLLVSRADFWLKPLCSPQGHRPPQISSPHSTAAFISRASKNHCPLTFSRSWGSLQRQGGSGFRLRASPLLQGQTENGVSGVSAAHTVLAP